MWRPRIDVHELLSSDLLSKARVEPLSVKNDVVIRVGRLGEKGLGGVGDWYMVGRCLSKRVSMFGLVLVCKGVRGWSQHVSTVLVFRGLQRNPPIG